MDIKNVNESEFQKEALEHNGVVLVDFWAPWCGPCKGYAPVFSKYAEQNPEVKCIKVNIDEAGSQSIASKYGIRSIPTTLLIKSGKALKGMAGAMNEAQLNSFVSSLKTA